MKTKCVAVSLMLLLAALAIAEPVSESRPFRIVAHNPQQIQIQLSAPEPEIMDLNELGTVYQQIKAAGAHNTALEGLPELPMFSTMVAIPAQGSYNLSYTVGSVKTINLPNPRLVKEDGIRLNEQNLDLNQLQHYPQTLVSGSEPQIVRDFRVIQLAMHPYVYETASQQLKCYQDIQITLDFNNEPGSNELPAYTGYSPIFAKLYEANIVNFEQYRILDLPQAHARILLIHGNSTDPLFLQKLNEFVTWKRQKGFEVNVVNTQTAGTYNTAIKNYIQSQYNNEDTRPDFIILLGDTTGSFPVPTFYETMSAYNGEGDYPYTHLAGTDLLGDAYIGRISVENISQLTAVFAKIYAVEKNVANTGDASAWLNRMLIIGDPSTSGMSCVYNGMYIREMALEVNPGYNLIENYTGGYASTMNTGINQGVALFNYRGYYGVSGWSPSASVLNNGPRLPHAIVLTCGTNSFAGSTSPMEEFFRMGTEAVPKGALSAIGMATTGTHTMFNNTLSSCAWEGVFVYDMRTMGEALLSSRLGIWRQYSMSHQNAANYFAHWINLMGDPTAEAFVGIPKSLHITAPDSIPLGAALVDIIVRDDLQIPMKDVSVTLYSSSYGNVVAKGFTDAEGFVSLNVPSYVSNQILVTASKHDCKPSQQDIIIDSTGSLVYFGKMFSEDGTGGSSGNNDGFASARETIALWVDIKNSTADPVSGITAALNCSDEYITLIQAQSSYSALNPSATAMNDAPFLFSVDANVPDQHSARFELTLTDSLQTEYTIAFHFGLFNAALSVANYSITAGTNQVLDPGETGFMALSVLNNSIATAPDIYGELRSMNDLLVVTDSLSYFGNIPAGMTINSVEGFSLFARPLLIPGMMIPLSLRLFNDQGFEQTAYFNLPIGTVSQNTPLGPDSYGYFIYDITDTAYPDCPTYEWIEINPTLGGSGSLITGFNDSGTSGDEGDQLGSVVLQVLDLPFTFRYYGIEYNQITVCVNGFIALGVTGDGEFRNARMPGGQGPSPMIAPFWDDLIIINDAGIYRWYDAAEHRLIIEYYKLRNGYNRTSEETFQVIFYDPVYHPTSMQDGMIKIQYKVFNNVDVGSSGGYTPRHGNYASIGIRDHTNTRGLEYSFNNLYPPAAAPLTHERALLITTAPVLHQSAYLVIGEININDDNGNCILEPGEYAEIGLKLNNLGLATATGVNLTVSTLSPLISLINPATTYPDIAGSASAINQNPISIIISPTCPADAVISLNCHILIDGNSWEYLLNLTVRKPQVQLSSLYMNDLQGNTNGLIEPGETVKLIVNYANNGEVDAANIISNITCVSEFITIQNPEILLDRIPAQSIRQAVYDVMISPSAVLGSNVTFFVTFQADQIPPQNDQFLVSIGTAGMENDFENNDGGFIPNPATNGWQWGTDTTSGAHSGTKVWGTLLNNSYPNNVIWTLTTPDVFIGSNYTLEFWHWYSMEGTYDGGNIKISTNNGATWNLLTPEGGYTHSNVLALNGPGFSGTSNGWSLVRIALGSYANQNVKFRFTFGADSIINGIGWYIDDVKTTGFIAFAGLLSGNVEASNPELDLNTVLIQNIASISAIPDPEGAYELYLPVGTHSVKASAPGYLSETFFPVMLNLTSPLLNHDFYLVYLPPAEGISHLITQEQLNLSWNAPAEPVFPITGYKIYRKLNAGKFDFMEQVDGTSYTEALSTIGNYHYRVTVLYSEGESLPSETVSFEFPVTPQGDADILPLVSKLHPNYPNPFNPSTTIRFDLALSGKVQLNVYNLRGQLVRQLVNEELGAGMHRVVWDGRDSHQRSVASGIYFLRLEARDYCHTHKAMLLK